MLRSYPVVIYKIFLEDLIMKLITEIIDILQDENTNLENALIKTKILLHRLGEKRLVNWVSKELNGYTEEDEVPEYRVLASQPKITASNGFTIWKEMPAVIGHLTHRQVENLTVSKWRDPISSIEHYTNSDGDTLSASIPPEFWPKLSEGLQEGIHVEYAHCVISKSQVEKIKTTIRSRLLDFLLDLENEFPDNVSLDKIKASHFDVGNLFNNAMFGDNTTIIVGHNNTQTINSDINKDELGDFISQVKEAFPLLEEKTKVDLDPYISYLENEISKETLDNVKVNELLKSIKTICEGAIGNLAASGILGILNKVFAI